MEQYSSELQRPARQRRYAVLLCGEDSDYVQKRYGGYFGVFMSLLADEDSGREAWDLYRVVRGQFPASADLASYDGFVVTGSCSDAHSDEPWICRLAAMLRALDGMGKRVLGICFGHQILCRALGGKTGRAAKGWDIGVTTINMSPRASRLLSSLQIQSSVLTVIECHRDEVYQLPPGAEVLAWSDKTGVEMFKYGDHMMGIQGHPEYTKDILLNIVDRLLQRNIVQISHANAARDTLDSRAPDREAWVKLCRTFLKGGHTRHNNVIPPNSS